MIWAAWEEVFGRFWGTLGRFVNHSGSSWKGSEHILAPTALGGLLGSVLGGPKASKIVFSLQRKPDFHTFGYLKISYLLGF